MSIQKRPFFEIAAIGQVRTSFDALNQCPSASRLNPAECMLELDSTFETGLTNIELASHLIVLYWLDKADRTALMRHSRPDEVQRGVFASRTPNRPNPVAVSIVKLEGREGNRLKVSGLDCLDGTKLVDIKPYVPEDDRIESASIGWNSACAAASTRSETVVQSQRPGGCGCS